MVHNNMLIIYREGLLATRLTAKLQDHRLSAVRGCLVNVLAAESRFLQP
jgi:hypothetical protein